MPLTQYTFESKEDPQTLYGVIETRELIFSAAEEITTILGNIFFQISNELFLQNFDQSKVALNLIALHNINIISRPCDSIQTTPLTQKELTDIFRRILPQETSNDDINKDTAILAKVIQKHLNNEEAPIPIDCVNILNRYVIYKITCPIKGVDFDFLLQKFQSFLQANIESFVKDRVLAIGTILTGQKLINQMKEDILFLIGKEPGLTEACQDLMGKMLTEFNSMEQIETQFDEICQNMRFLCKKIADAKQDFNDQYCKITNALNELTQLDEKPSDEEKNLAEALNPFKNTNAFVQHVTREFSFQPQDLYEPYLTTLPNNEILKYMLNAYIHEYIASVGKVEGAGLFSKYQMKSRLGQLLEKHLLAIINKTEFDEAITALNTQRKERGSNKNIILCYAENLFPNELSNPLRNRLAQWEANGLPPKDRECYINTARALNRMRTNYPAVSSNRIAKEADKLIKKYDSEHPQVRPS